MHPEEEREDMKKKKGKNFNTYLLSYCSKLRTKYPLKKVNKFIYLPNGPNYFQIPLFIRSPKTDQYYLPSVDEKK